MSVPCISCISRIQCFVLTFKHAINLLSNSCIKYTCPVNLYTEFYKNLTVRLERNF